MIKLFQFLMVHRLDWYQKKLKLMLHQITESFFQCSTSDMHHTRVYVKMFEKTQILLKYNNFCK